MIVAALVVAVGVSSCTGAEPPLEENAETPSPPVTLRLGTPEEAGRPGYEIAERFADAVADASNGEVTVELVEANLRSEPAFDQAAVQELRDGDVELGLIPTRTWHSAGVTTLEALQLPTLIETDDQADRVAQSAVIPDMLAGLDELDLTGLGVYPEGLRHLATYGDLGAITATNLRGTRVRAPRADTPWATIRALGATPVESEDFGSDVESGRIRAAEASLALLSTLPEGPVMTANISIYYKFQLLAIRDDALARLDPAVQESLRTAATTTLTRTSAERTREKAALETACADRSEVTTATGNRLTMDVTAASAAARRTVYAQMREVLRDAQRDPDHARFIRAVSAAAGPADTAVTKGCRT